MILDLFSLYIASGLVITVVSTMYGLEVVSRGATPVDRIWSLALGSALATAVCYAAAASLPELWWCVGLGNGASLMTTFAMWSGVRAYDGRRPLLWVGAAVAAAGMLTSVVQGPAAGEWAGGAFMIAGTGAGALLAAAETFRSRMRRAPTGRVLTVVLLVVGSFYVVRLFFYATGGPYSHAFRTYAGTEFTTLVVMLLVLAAAFAMTALRAEHVHRQHQEQQNFDPMTGARTGESFRRRGERWLVVAQGAGRPVAVVSVVLESAAQLTTAFGADYAERAMVTVGEICREDAPPPALVGRSEADAEGFEVLLVGQSPAAVEAWAEHLRKLVIDSPLEVPGTTVRLRVSIGVAADTRGRHDLAELSATATERAHEALAAGGNRVAAAAR